MIGFLIDLNAFAGDGGHGGGGGGDVNMACAVRFRYLFRSLLTLRSMVYDALGKFERIYDLQDDGRVFETPEDLWSESLDGPGVPAPWTAVTEATSTSRHSNSSTAVANLTHYCCRIVADCINTAARNAGATH